LPHEISARQRREQQGFDRQPGQRFHAGHFANQAVKPKGPRHSEREPRDESQPADEVRYPNSGQHDGCHLQPTGAFAQENNSEQHAEEWIDEVAETGLDNSAADNARDVDQPVGGQHQRTQHQQKQQPP
jgi:hypothetical protein